MPNLISQGKKALFAAVVIATAGALGVTTAASATPSSGDIRRAPISSGVLDGPQKSKADGIQLKTKGPVKVDDVVLTYKPGATSGWHSHPGIVIATVITGKVKRTLSCGRAETFGPGESFTEVGPHFVANTGKVDASLSITLIYPADWAEPTTRIDESKPICRGRAMPG
ncbi:cupin domain-containing protein [Nakamurella sp. GG22]